MDVGEQLEIIRRGVADIIPETELLQKLDQSVRTGKPLRVKYGIDPTSPDVHLGHTVPLRTLRKFQELGHQAVVIIGNYTSQVGDPSGRDSTRRGLSGKEAEENARTYLAQMGKILDLDRLEVVRNGDWFAKMDFADVIRLAAKMTVARCIERDDFSKRYQAGVAIYLHELLYPLMQGYDSVMVRSDIELGATEQTFNMLVARDMQREAGMEPQVCITFPILLGTDGEKRMGKSLGNYIGVSEPPDQMYGKVMSIPDSAMGNYFELVTDFPRERIEELLSPETNPKDAKVELARNIVRQFHGAEAADSAAAEFERIYSQGERPTDIREISLPPEHIKDAKIWVVRLLTAAQLVESSSEARRLIIQGAVEIDGKLLSDPEADVSLQREVIVQVGKHRFAKIRAAK